MPFTEQDVRANADYFAAKLRAVRSVADVVERVKGGPGAPDFLLLDVRSREKFAKGHVWGALSVPVAEIEALAERLPKERAYVTYCGGET